MLTTSPEDNVYNVPPNSLTQEHVLGPSSETGPFKTFFNP